MLSVDIKGLDRAIKELLAVDDEIESLEEFFRGPATRVMKRTFTDIFRGEGQTKQTPRWRELSAGSRKAREGRWGNSKILRRTGRLRRSYTQTPVVHVEAKQMRISSNVPYAGYHETGTRRMPARPVIGYAAKVAPSRLQRALNKYLREKFD